MRVIVDGDGQPDKEEIIEAAGKRGVKVIIVTSLSHHSERLAALNADIVLVDNRKQEADIKIVNLMEKGDLVITQDSGLAYLALGKGAVVLGPSGSSITVDNAAMNLSKAHLIKKNARAGRKRVKQKGPVPRTENNTKTLIEAVNNAINGA